MGISQYDPAAAGRPAWNAGKQVGAKRALKVRQIWSIRFFLDREGRMRDRALFDLAIDSKLRGCDLVKIKIGTLVAGPTIRARSIVIQQKTGRPVQFEITADARASLLAWPPEHVSTAVVRDDIVRPLIGRARKHLAFAMTILGTRTVNGCEFRLAASSEGKSMANLASALTINDLKRQARRRVPKMFFDYADSGSWTQSTYLANEAEFAQVKLRQKVAVNMENRTLATTMVGQPVSMPIAIAPAAIAGLQIADGEILAARAAEKFGIPFTLSTMSICSIEDVAEAVGKPFWFQIYTLRDKSFMERLIDRAKAARCSALVLTMDLQILGQRHADIRNNMKAPPKITPAFVTELMRKPRWALGMLGAKRRTFANVVGHASNVSDLSSLSTWIAEQFDPRVTWAEVGWVRSRFGGPVIVKGILDPDDARAAVAAGADAVIVSNHGGRQLDGAPSSIRVLPEIVDAVGHKTEVLMDGGIRSGQDVLKALALGAKSTFIGRPMLYGLGAGGEAGVTRALSIIHREADITMALMGERDVRDIGPHNIYSNDLLRR